MTTVTAIGVGMPAWLYLNQFGRMVHDAFGEWPYLVGSATYGKQWRDVDVRLILADDDYARLIGPLARPEAMNQRWSAFCMAFSELGRRVTGLPIDFQIQQRTQANAEFPRQMRHALILAAHQEPAPDERRMDDGARGENAGGCDTDDAQEGR